MARKATAKTKTKPRTQRRPPAKAQPKTRARRRPAAKPPLEPVPSNDDQRYSILVCIDGSETSLQALKYAVRVGSGIDADLTLLYVRPIDQGLRTGGLQISVVRENLLDWGLELPGMAALKRGRQLLVDLGWMKEEWEHELAHVDVKGDPLGDNAVVYSSPEGRSVVLRLLVAPSVAFGILDEAKLGEFDLVIISRQEHSDAMGPGQITPDVADRVAREHSGTVLVIKEMEESHGHMVCVTAKKGSIRAARIDAEIASRCACPVYLLSVAKTRKGLKDARRAVEVAKKEIERVGIRVSGEKVRLGDPVTCIVDEGKKYSVIVLSRHNQRTGWRQIFSGSIAFKVLEQSSNSVMIAR